MEYLLVFIVIIFFICVVGRIMRCPKCRTWFTFVPHSIVDAGGLPTDERINICYKCGHEASFTATKTPDGCSEESYFADDIARLDQEQPDWDHLARIAAARRMLKTGMKRETLVAIYTEEIVREVESKVEDTVGGKL